ncbi:MAG: four helix bundle protein [candidate division WOR-3 bacterium]|nr:MAG: four helix bundle protein [candidate division WOR-3 bacterium]
MTIERFEDIESWQLARQLTRQVYACTAGRDFSRDFGLRDQIQRAAGSAMHNIAEGFDSGSDTEFTRFLRYAQRSCTEVQSELYVALDQKYISEQQFREVFEQAERVHAKIGGFIKYLLSSTKDKATKDSPLRPARRQGTKGTLTKD